MNAEDIIINIIKRDRLFSSNEVASTETVDALNSEVDKLLRTKNSHFKTAHFSKKMIFLLSIAGIIAGGAGISTYSHYINELNNVVIPACFGITSIGSLVGAVGFYAQRSKKLKTIKEVQKEIDNKINEIEVAKKVKKTVNGRVNELSNYLDNQKNPTILAMLKKPLPNITCKKVYSLLASDEVPIPVIIYAIGKNEVDVLSSLLSSYNDIKDTESPDIVDKRKELITYRNRAINEMDGIINNNGNDSPSNIADDIFKKLNG